MKLLTLIFGLSTILSASSCCPPEANTAVSSADSDAETVTVKPGIEVLRASGFAALSGKRVGLITNPTGIDNNLRSTIDILAEAENVNLTALFAPEHGVRGDYTAGETVMNEVDRKTGVPVYSLHGRTRKPTPEMLKDIDVLVYDIQDIGCRSYTFISTMGLAMEAAARDGKDFMVLDRPDPLGGERVEGNLVERGRESFVGQFPIPYIYGLTPGELATYLNEKGIVAAAGKKVRLTVIPMEGWHRDMTFAETGMPWVLPSPHIPTPEAALMYPATGIMGELNYVSIGVGYTLPFSLTGAPWIDAQKLADRLNALSLDGIEFRPMYYKPYYAMYKGEKLGGVQIYAQDWAATPLSLVQFYIMQELASLYPTHKAFASGTQSVLKMFDMVCGSAKIRQQFTRSYMVDDIYDLWMNEAKEFKAETSKYYLYD
ncbi:MAG: DUF1343 domain-containing protein [Bacteroides sp.]|nr:DUF1343 domain-containing protein [Bacteroides sp.]